MVNNWNLNSEMKNLMKHISTHPSSEGISLNMQQLKSLFFPSFKSVKDCIIITDKDIDKLILSFDNVIKMYGDRTGYEASNTETRVNCYFENEISMETGTRIAIMAIEIWSLRLKQMEPESQFCFILSSDEERVEFRFHKIHENEIMWLANDLESYNDGAIGYVVI